ncbi:hypothetical protein IQ274_25830 [Nostoc sp. LEGE 12447]|uniref:hypothetical protein n=1 Tax=Nostoc sp. LEGE 12447 TaxID=1828640 RepID=UPI0018836797|nr:hypothetical protein [Nostoc sp. LEGE 12447]MBE9001542.1 hypothetical protein [Nostoc sp. LEGE 12447]
MAQIKVLDLNNVYSLSELSSEDTKQIIGGTIREYRNGRWYYRQVTESSGWWIFTSTKTKALSTLD